MHDRIRIKYSANSPKPILQLFAGSLEKLLKQKKTLDELPTFIETK